MILKVLQPDTGKWFYYDKVRLFKVKHSVIYPEEFVEEKEDEVILLPTNTTKTSNTPKELPEGLPPETAVRCDVCFEDGGCKVIWCREGYLLNDGGKTIERIA